MLREQIPRNEVKEHFSSKQVLTSVSDSFHMVLHRGSNFDRTFFFCQCQNIPNIPANSSLEITLLVQKYSFIPVQLSFLAFFFVDILKEMRAKHVFL